MQQASIEHKSSHDLKAQELLNLKHKLDLVEMEKRYSESSNAKKLMEQEKLHALLEQKLKLTEKESEDFRTKLAEKDKDMKDLQKEYY